MMGGSDISWTICKSFAPRCRQMTTPVPHSVFTGRMLFLLPSQQHQSTEGKDIPSWEGFWQADCICCAHWMASVQSAVIVCLQLSNGEMFWVVTEVCSELNVARRAKIIKHFIQIASKFVWQIINTVLAKIYQHLLMQKGSIYLLIYMCLILCGFLYVAHNDRVCMSGFQQ